MSDRPMPHLSLTERPMPWEHWSKDRRQWTALGTAAALVVLGAVVGLLTLWS